MTIAVFIEKNCCFNMSKNAKHYNDLEEIQGIVGQIRGLNESVNFCENFDDEEPQPEFGEEPSVPAEELPVAGDVEGGKDLSKLQPEEPNEEDGLRELGDEVDTIREIALKGMIKLCKNPEDERYQALKKIFQFCDKAAEVKKGDEE